MGSGNVARCWTNYTRVSAFAQLLWRLKSEMLYLRKCPRKELKQDDLWECPLNGGTAILADKVKPDACPTLLAALIAQTVSGRRPWAFGHILICAATTAV